MLGPGDAGVDENEAEAAAGQTCGERVDAFRPVKSTSSTAIPPSEAATSSASSVAAAALRAVAVTCQPRRANSRASPRPKPREAPTMIAALFWSWSGAAVAMVILLLPPAHLGRLVGSIYDQPPTARFTGRMAST